MSTYVAKYAEQYPDLVGLDANQTPSMEALEKIALNSGIPKELVQLGRAVIQQESGNNSNAQNPKSTAGGLMQTINATGKSLGIENKYDPAQSYLGGINYLNQGYKDTGSLRGATQWYHDGPGEYKASGGVPRTEESIGYQKAIHGSSGVPEASGAVAESGVPSKLPTDQVTLPTEKSGGGFGKNILPLLLRFALPAIAGGVIGQKMPFGAAGGALGGLASAGLGYGAGVDKQREAQADRDATAKTANTANYWKAAELGLNKDKFEEDKLKRVFDEEQKEKEFTEKGRAAKVTEGQEERKTKAAEDAWMKDTKEADAKWAAIRKMVGKEKIETAEDERKLKAAIMMHGLAKSADLAKEDSVYQWGTDKMGLTSGTMASFKDAYNAGKGGSTPSSVSIELTAPDGGKLVVTTEEEAKKLESMGAKRR